MTNNMQIKDLENIIVRFASMLEPDGPQEEKRAVIRLNRSEAAALAEAALLILAARGQAEKEQGKTPFMHIKMGLN